MTTFPRPPAEMALQDRPSLALLGHDLRALLAEVRSELRMLKALKMPDPCAAAVDRCRASGDALARLIDQSVLVCLGQASPDLVGEEPVQLADFQSDLAMRWTSAAAGSGHRFKLIVAGKLPDTLTIDRTAIERILGNLIANAILHTPPCAVTATIKINDDLLHLLVEDEGPGFAPTHMATLSETFEIPPEARRVGGGYGLQAVKMLVTALGGRAYARNKSAGGAAVNICLPLRAQGQVATDVAPVLPQLPDLTGLRLFLADDSPASRELTCLLARAAGAEITAFSNGAQVQAALSSGPAPDLLILDAEMPGRTGLEVLAWLRLQPVPLADLPVLVLTSHNGADALAALHLAGAVQIMAKPALCPVELGRAIKACLGHPMQAAQLHDLTPLLRLADIAGPTAAAELFARLQEDLSTAQTGLNDAAAARDMLGLRNHSHVVIALAGTVGADALHRDAVYLNSLAHDTGASLGAGIGAGPDAAFALARALGPALSALIKDVRRAALLLPPAQVSVP